MQIEKIWPEYRARIKAFLHAKVSNPADVDDLLQDISIKVFTGLPALRDPSKLQSWLFQTADRTITDYYRKNARSKTVDPEDLWYSAEDPGIREELEGCVEPFIRGLPTETAELLMEIDIRGMSQKDYAEAHGLSYSTLKSRVQKGRDDLRKSFEDCCNWTMDARGNISEYHFKSNTCENC